MPLNVMSYYVLINNQNIRISFLNQKDDITWAGTPQNPQTTCSSSIDSDQPGHLPNLTRVFHSVWRWFGSWTTQTVQSPDWSEFSLGTHVILLVLSCFSSYYKVVLKRTQFKQNKYTNQFFLQFPNLLGSIRGHVWQPFLLQNFSPALQGLNLII